MNKITVKRGEVLARIRANRDAHQDLFTKAQAGFRARAIEELYSMIEAARKGDVRLYVGLTPPSDHTADYDRAIDMLEMSVHEVIDMDAMEFVQLVRNEWQWFQAVTATNAVYASGGKLGGSR